MKKNLIPLLIFGVWIFGCATTPKMTQTEMREFQTRTFDINSTKTVMKAMLNVFQDEGFIVKEGNVDLGLLTATKEVDVESFGSRLAGTLFGGKWEKNMILEATANVSEFGSQTRVRINFQKKVMDNKGGVKKVEQIVDAAFYQDFFAKVDKSIFLEKEKI